MHEAQRLCSRLERASLRALEGLVAALEARDRHRAGHSGRVGDWARRTALALGWSEPRADLVGQAARLHDLGMIGVPEAVLQKSGPLSAEEREPIRRHPEQGRRILAPFESFAGIAEIIRHHHERWDGSGYPDGLAGPAIPAGARLVAVADLFDALTSDRPHRSALPVGAAVDELRRQGGRALDSQLVEVFLAAQGLR